MQATLLTRCTTRLLKLHCSGARVPCRKTVSEDELTGQHLRHRPWIYPGCSVVASSTSGGCSPLNILIRRFTIPQLSAFCLLLLPGVVPRSKPCAAYVSVRGCLQTFPEVTRKSPSHAAAIWRRLSSPHLPKWHLAGFLVVCGLCSNCAEVYRLAPLACRQFACCLGRAQQVGRLCRGALLPLCPFHV